MNTAPKRLARGHSVPRKTRNLTGSRSVWEGDVGMGDWNARRVEKAERNRDERPTRERGRERERVGWEGKEREAGV
jgi:hypothetical protein